MSQADRTERLQALRQRIAELTERLDKPRKTDKAALKAALQELSAALEGLDAPAGPAAAPEPAPEAPGARPAEQERKEEFLSILGHELRNSLAPILNSLHVLQLRGGGDEGQRRFLEVIDRQTRHMAHLVANLLDVSRIARGKIELQKEPVALATLMSTAVETCRPLIESRSQRLAVSLPPRTVVVEADRGRMEQALANLLTNAAKYTDLNGQIWFQADFQNGEATVRVRDTGVGIAPEVLPHLFDPFSPMVNSSARTRGGLGLGLSLVSGLIRMHGGAIEVFSEGPGKGSEFLVRLPAAQQTLSEGEPAPSAEGAAAEHEQPLRVLVVEDNKDTASTLGVILKLWGHEIEIAYNGHAGLNAARQFRPDVVLLDIELPGLDGYEVAKAMRQVPELEQTTVVAISGFGQPEDQARSREAGINYHYTKPIDLPSLRKLLATSEKRAAV